MNKVIELSLDSASIDRAIRELRDYKKRLIRKAEELRVRVAELIRDQAQTSFFGAIADDLLNEEAIIGSVDVVVEDSGDFTVVIAKGQDAVFIEFGAGVYHNGAVGGSPHPKGLELGYTIGGYGLGNGAKKVWGFKDTGGELHLTHGAPASMPMYKALMAVRQDLERIAKEVFSS